MNTYGKQPIDVLSDGTNLPDGTSADSTSMAYVGRNTGGRIALSVYAKTAISIGAANDLSIELQAYSSDSSTDATSPFSTEGVLEDNAHVLLLEKVGSTDGQLDFAAGEMILQWIVPGEWLDKLNYDWIQLLYTTSVTQSGEEIDAFTHFID